MSTCLRAETESCSGTLQCMLAEKNEQKHLLRKSEFSFQDTPAVPPGLKNN